MNWHWEPHGRTRSQGPGLGDVTSDGDVGLRDLDSDAPAAAAIGPLPGSAAAAAARARPSITLGPGSSVHWPWSLRDSDAADPGPARGPAWPGGSQGTRTGPPGV